MNRVLLVLVAALTSCRTDTPPGSDTASETGECPPDSWVRYDNFAQPLITTWCLPCHSASIPEALRQGAQVGIDFDSYEGTVQWSERMVDRITVRADMPPLAGPSPEERAWFAEWVACGMPEAPQPIPPPTCSTLTWIEGDAGPDLCASGNAVRGDAVLDTDTDVSCLCQVDGDLLLSGNGARSLPALTQVGGTLSAEGSGVDSIEIPELTQVSGAVHVTGNAALSQLLLPKLATVGGEAVVAENALTSLDMTGLRTVGGDLRITDDPVLSVVDLARVQSVTGTVELSRLDGLTLVRNPDAIQAVGGDLLIENNPSLATIGAFVSVATVGGSIRVQNTDLVNLGGFNELTTVGGDIVVSNNASMTQVVAFGALTTVGGAFDLHENTRLSQILAPSNLISLGGALLVAANPSLPSVDGFDSLTTIGGTLTIAANGELTTIDGFDALNSAGGIVLDNNPLLTRATTFGEVSQCGELTLTALPALLSVPTFGALSAVGDLEIDTTAAPNLNGFAALRNVNGYLRIEANPSLVSILGLSDVNAITGALTIRDNPLLPTTEATSVAAGIVVSGPTEISGNGPG